MPAKENFFRQQKVRSTNMDRSQDTLNTNITERMKSLSTPGVETGLQIRYLDGTPATVDGGTGTTSNAQILVDNAYTVSVGQAWDSNGERVVIETDEIYVAGNPSLTDSQVPPVATPQSTGNVSVPFAQVASLDVDTFVCIKYLQTTDLSELADVVPGANFEYPKLDDGYEIQLFSSSGDVTAALAGGSLFLAFIRVADGLVSHQWPVVSGSPTFVREEFGVNITVHAADEDAHHAKVHGHTTADGSAETNLAGEVLIGDGEEVRVGGENFRDTLAHQFRPGVIFDPVLITDSNALEPQSNPLLTIGGLFDTFNILQLRDGEKIFVNGRAVEQITGTSTSTGSGAESLVHYKLTGPSGNYWLVVDESGALGTMAQGTPPIDKFIVCSFSSVTTAKVSGGASAIGFGNSNGTTDLRDFGTVGTDALKSSSLKEVAAEDTLKEALEVAGVGVWTKYTVYSDDLTSTGAFQDVPLFTLATKGVVESVIIKHNNQFNDAPLTSYTVEVGTGNAGVPGLFASAFDIFQSVGDTVAQSSTQSSFTDFASTTQVYATFRQGGGQINSVAGGKSVDIWAKVSTLP